MQIRLNDSIAEEGGAGVEAEELFAILMIQAPNQREFYRPLFRDLVYAMLVD